MSATPTIDALVKRAEETCAECHERLIHNYCDQCGIGLCSPCAKQSLNKCPCGATRCDACVTEQQFHCELDAKDAAYDIAEMQMRGN